MTNKERQRRGFTIDPNCPCSPEIVEDLDHVFRHGTRALPVWEFFNDRGVWRDLHHLNFEEWFTGSLKDQRHIDTNMEWKDNFAICL